jgi:hypothetical protein
MSGVYKRSATAGTRVADKVLQTFDYACVMGDHETAAALLTVLEDMADRKARRFGGERRSSGVDLDAARTRLEGIKSRNPWEAAVDDQPAR